MKKLDFNIFSKKDEIFLLGGKLKINNGSLEHELHLVDTFRNNNKHNDEIKNLLRHGHIEEANLNKLVKLLHKYPEMIKDENDPLKSTKLLKHTINLKTDKPIYSRNYRYPHQFKGDISQEIEKLLKSNIIRESKSPYNSPIWVVPKKTDASGKKKIRMVIDYRKLNQETIPDKFPLPNIEDLLNQLNNAQIFSTLDLASGFHQIEMDEGSIEKTAFSTESGHYEFLRMPFGLCNAPPTFQRAMNMMLSNTPNCLVYMDDIIIFSKNIEEHLQHLEIVFNKLNQHSLTIQLDKTEFLKSELPFLGYIVSKEGLKTNPSKVEAIEKFPLPTTHKGIKQFLGMTGYYRKFIHNYAHLAKPLTQSLRIEEKTICPSSYQEAFNLLKQHLLNAPILQFPDWELPFILTTDASSVALGAVLSQISEGRDHPITFASRTLSDTEQRYSTIEKELLAIVYACNHFKPYLYGKKFLIHTDHKPLIWLFTMKNTNARLMKWIFQLSDFEFEIKHIEGKTNYVADALSRNPHALNAIEEVDYEELDRILEETSNMPLDFSDELEEFLEEFDTIGNTDSPTHNELETSSLATVHSQDSSNQQIWIVDQDKPINIEKFQIFIQRGKKLIRVEKLFNKTRFYIETAYPWSNDLNDILLEIIKPNTTYGVFCEPNIETVRSEFEGIFLKLSQTIQENYPSVKIKRYKKKCLDITNQDQQLDIINSYHLGKTCHRGSLETYEKLKRDYYWPRMKDAITDYCNKCQVCRKTKYDRKPIKTKFCVTPTPDKPFEELMIDTLHFEQKYIITIADTFSKRLFARLTDACNSIQVSEVIIEYLELYPSPDRIKMDNGREYKNNLVENLLSSQGIEPYYVTPNHPNSLGLLNRTHSTLIEILRNLKETEPNIKLKKRLCLAVVAFNNSLNQKLKLTPNEITFGAQKYKENKTPVTEKLVEQYHNNLKLIHEQIKTRIDKEKETRTDLLNQNREDANIPDNTYARVRTRNKNENPFKPVYKLKDNKREILVHSDNIQRTRKNYKNKAKPQTSYVSENAENGNNTSPMDVS